MIRRILTFFILLLTLILTSCEHKELKFPETVKFRSLRVVLKWEQLADFQKPKECESSSSLSKAKVILGYSTSRMAKTGR